MAETACTLHLDGKQLADCDTYSFLIFLRVMKVRIHPCGLVVLSIEGGRKGLRYSKGVMGGRKRKRRRREREPGTRERVCARARRGAFKQMGAQKEDKQHGGGGGGQGEEESDRETCFGAARPILVLGGARETEVGRNKTPMPQQPSLAQSLFPE